jgi:hypothetical protein
MDFEIYESTEGKKKRFFVVPMGKYLSDDIVRCAKRFFKVSADKLALDNGYVINDELWIDERPKGSKPVFVVSVDTSFKHKWGVIK